MQLFFDKDLDTNQPTFLVEKDESKHILRVLRKKIGDTIYITNGKGLACEGEIIGMPSKQCEIKILEKYEQNELPYKLHIGIGPTKSADRFEYFLEKVTEIGITEITPIICKNSERKRLNMSRCEKILQSAMKQSQRFYLPKLNELKSLDQFLSIDFSQTEKFIAHCEDREKFSFKETISESKDILLLIGPEGDFSKTEIDNILKNKFRPVSLGETRLRTETAGIVATTIVAFG